MSKQTTTFANIDSFFKAAQDIIKNSKTNNYNVDYVNTREFEEECTDLSKRIDLSIITCDKLKDFLDKHIIDASLDDKKAILAVLFAYSTACRRSKKDGAYALTENYKMYFINTSLYSIYTFLEALTCFAETNDPEAIKDLISLISALLNDPIFKNHIGIMHFYCDMVATYYEWELEKKNDLVAQEDLYCALKKIKEVLKMSGQSANPKFHVTYGRILVLLGKYSEGEQEMRKAISKLDRTEPTYPNRLLLFESYLIKATTIRQFDLSNDKYKELNKIKVDNLKIVTLMTTVLGFLLGSISIFSTITDPFNLAMLLIAYSGLLLILCGVMLAGLSLLFKDRKKSFTWFYILLALIGGIVLAISITFICNHPESVIETSNAISSSISENSLSA